MSSALAQKQHLVAMTAARKSGAACTFTLSSPGTYDPAAGTYTGASTSSVIGYATQMQGNPVTYEKLGLIESEAPTLDFAPDTLGEVPALGSSATINGVAFVVRDVDPWAPDGVARSAKVVVSR